MIEWEGFIQGKWQEEINVRDFIATNYVEYQGQESFLAGATEKTTALKSKYLALAEEVAARSAQAAKETTDLIEGSIKKVAAGANITNGTTAAFKRMSDDVGKVADLLDSIALAASEQSSAIEQINQGISQVSQVVQNNAAISEESAAASIELTAQAQKLKELLAVFKIKKGAVKTEITSEAAADSKAEIKTETKIEAEKAQVQTKISEPIVSEQKKIVQERLDAKPMIKLSDDDFGKY